jgi:hypothetical protein
MKPWSSAVVGLAVGTLLASLFGVRRGDLWLAGSIGVTAAIATYGFLAYPQYRSRWSGHGSTFWYALTGVLAPALMLFTPNSPLLTDTLSVVVLVGCLWIGGVYAGIALVHDSLDATEATTDATAQSASGD